MAQSMNFIIINDKAKKLEDGQFFTNEILFNEIRSLTEKGTICTGFKYNNKSSDKFIYTFLVSSDSLLYGSHGIDRVRIRSNKMVDYLDSLVTLNSRIIVNDSNLFTSELNKDIALVTYRTEKRAKGLRRKESGKRKVYNLSKYLIF